MDYNFYQSEYGGKVIEQEFNRLLIQAKAMLSYYTFNRASDKDINVKYTLCELVDYLKELQNKGGKEIASEEVSTHSVTYADKDNISSKKKQKEIMMKYLGHTNLLYRGI